ncbi:GNAT family N-acetyltransferase [Nocardioides sp. LHG3406-4]|uniref:GNAT family N-acetyltransferase n=1 Tax=Nocardioides sp. LHG3406-4 TaxID=2804575 RepID=UPI003CEF745B
MTAAGGWRRAGADDAAALMLAERATNLVALAHVFPPDRFPFPDDDVLARWALVLDDPGVTVEVFDGPEGVLAFSAWDVRTLRHLGVHPDRWGSGLGRAGVERAVAAIRDGGETPYLWCLVDNHRARGLYEHLGWVPTGERGEAEFPPHPTQMRYVLGD